MSRAPHGRASPPGRAGRARVSRTTVVTGSAVPVTSTTTPASIAPAPTDAACSSPVPTTTAHFAGRPSSEATSGRSVPTTSVDGRTGAKHRRVQAGCRTQRVVEVAAGDVVHHRGRRVRGVLGVRAGKVVQHIRPDGRQHRRTLPDRRFVVADPHHLRCTVRRIGHQTRSARRAVRAPTAATSRSHCSVARLSSQMIAGRSGSPSASHATTPSTWLPRPIATTRVGVDACGRRADGVAKCGAVGVRVLFRPAVVLVRHASARPNRRPRRRHPRRRARP